MFKPIILFALSTASLFAQDAPCVIDGASTYEYVDLGAGVTHVNRITYWFPTGSRTSTPVADITREQLRSHYQGLLQDSALVFLGRIDSVIQLPAGDTSNPVTPWRRLTRDSTAPANRFFRFYARIRIDSLLRGSLPHPSFWIEGERPEACSFKWEDFQGKTFLNSSSGLSKMTDLKLDLGGRTLPTGYWFDGRYLTTPPFYGVRLDITEVMPDYPATSLLMTRSKRFRQGTPAGASYQPDGRRVGESFRGRSALPELRRH